MSVNLPEFEFRLQNGGYVTVTASTAEEARAQLEGGEAGPDKLVTMTGTGRACDKCGRVRVTLVNDGSDMYPFWECGTCSHRRARRINTREMWGRGRRGY